MDVHAVAAVTDAVRERRGSLDIRLRQDVVTDEAAVLALARLRADPDQFPVARQVDEAVVLDVVPGAEELVEDLLPDLGGIANRVALAAALRDPEETELGLRPP